MTSLRRKRFYNTYLAPAVNTAFSQVLSPPPEKIWRILTVFYRISPVAVATSFISTRLVVQSGSQQMWNCGPMLPCAAGAIVPVTGGVGLTATVSANFVDASSGFPLTYAIPDVPFTQDCTLIIEPSSATFQLDQIYVVIAEDQE